MSWIKNEKYQILKNIPKKRIAQSISQDTNRLTKVFSLLAKMD